MHQGLAAVKAAIAVLRSEDPGSATDIGLAAELHDLHWAMERLNGEWLRRLAAFDGRGGAVADGHLTTASWLREQCLLTPGAANQRVESARAVRERTPVGEALRIGEISMTHARVIRKGVESLPAEVSGTVETILVNSARGNDPSALRGITEQLRHQMAPALLAEEHDDQHARRYLSISQTIGGAVVFDGMLDRESGEFLMTAIQTLSLPTGPDDERTAKQRRADGLVQIARFGLESAEMPDVNGERPHVSIVIPLDTLRGVPGSPPAAAEWTGPWSTDVVRRVLCDAGVSRIITDGASQVLDVGRLTRIVSAPMRRALAVRDKGCIIPSCHRPPRWTDAHHVVHWTDGGATTLSNLVLLCRTHHDAVHKGIWLLVWDSAEQRYVAKRPDPLARFAALARSP
jgi:hypothetical protein